MVSVRVLAFDIQGTVVDFHGPVMRMGAAVNARKGLAIDWDAFSVGWRDAYRDGMNAVIAGERPWLRVDAIYREGLDRLLAEEGLATQFDDIERAAINAVWTRLTPWPDSVPGLTRLRRRHTLATLSNAGMAALVAVVKHAGLPFDAVLSAELARTYKPDPAVYRLVFEYLGVPPGQAMMVASHKYDLQAAAALGMRTAFVARPLEFGPKATPDVAFDPAFDINARDLADLADQLGA